MGCPWMLISCSTSAACRIRISSRACATSPDETGPWRVTLNVTNLANETYATCSTDVACFYGGERSFIGNVRYRF